MSSRQLNIGLFGFGCVGFGLYEVLSKTPTLKANIRRICVKDRNKSRPVDASHFVYDKHAILGDEDINLVVELIDDADAAFEIVSEALRRGKAVVSANKKMIAEHFDELLDLQRQYKVPFLYEAACCASIPIIRNLEEYYDNDLLERIEGIVNGSTNYILTKTFSENLSYPEALHQAQQLGYAESNPILDTGGFDAKYKLVILLAHAFGLIVPPDEIINIGIDHINDLEIRYAREKGLKIKLVATAYKTEEEKVAAFVMPKFVSPQSKLYTVDDVFNGVITKTCFADQQFFAGRGAGAHPTASAVLSDISALRYDYKYEYKKHNDSVSLESPSRIFLHVFLRHEEEGSSWIRSFFEAIHESYSNARQAYTAGIITLEKLSALTADPAFHVSPVLVDTVEDYLVVKDEVVKDEVGEVVLEEVAL
jgi:homoserine dehydrogenase